LCAGADGLGGEGGSNKEDTGEEGTGNSEEGRRDDREEAGRQVR